MTVDRIMHVSTPGMLAKGEILDVGWESLPLSHQKRLFTIQLIAGARPARLNGKS